MALPEISLDEILEKMSAAIGGVKDYTCITEGYSARAGKEGWRTNEFKFIKEPEMVWSKVVKNKSNYRSRSMPGSKYLLKDGRIEARLTGLLGLIPLKARADDKLAMWHRGERLDHSHIVFFAKQLARDHEAGNLSLAGTAEVDGREMYVLETKNIDPKKNFGISSCKVWIDPGTFYILKLEKYEESTGKAVSSWTIKQLKVNVNLKKSEFTI